MITSLGAVLLTMISMGAAQAAPITTMTVDGITVSIHSPGTSGIESIGLSFDSTSKTISIQETWTSTVASYLEISGLAQGENYTIIKEITNNTGVEWTSLANELLDPATGFDNDSKDGVANFPVPSGFSASSDWDGLSFAQSGTIPRISSIFDTVVADESVHERDFLDYISTTGASLGTNEMGTVQFGLRDWNPAGNQIFLLAQRPNERSIPEPATLALMGLGLAGIGIGRRRQRKKSL